MMDKPAWWKYAVYDEVGVLGIIGLKPNAPRWAKDEFEAYLKEQKDLNPGNEGTIE